MQSELVSAALGALNPAQRAAVEHVGGPLLVIAGAGSGKTRVLTTRIAHLIANHGVQPHEVLVLTFTNKAAGEMRGRIERLLGGLASGMWMGTFHSVGARMLRQWAPHVGRSRAFTIYDEDDVLGVVKRLMERHQISSKEWSALALRRAIDDARSASVKPDEYAKLARDPLSRAAAVVYAGLEAELRAANAVSFDDLLSLPGDILEANPGLLEAARARFRTILVDEYQDTNPAQYRLVHLLGREHGNVTVVGDDDQSIYGWRGATIRNILEFEKDFPRAAIVRLEENYRSTPSILNVANLVIKENRGRHGKTLRAMRADGERPTVCASVDERDEAAWVVAEIQKRRYADHGLRLRDVAVLYRTNAQSRAMEEAMLREVIPYRLIGAVRFYDRREVRDMMSYLKLIANPRDGEAFRRAIAIPRRGLGDAALAVLDERAREAGISLLEAAARPDLLADMGPKQRSAFMAFAALIDRYRLRAAEEAVHEVLGDLIEEIGYFEVLRAEGPEGAERVENVRELLTSAAETVADEGGEVGLSPLDHFLERVALVADADALDADADAVTAMTLHTAKGLEFPMVFIVGVEEGLCPLYRTLEDPSQVEEERRLFYVGITRAERKLFLSHARNRRRNGVPMPSMASSFLRAIPKGVLEETATAAFRTHAASRASTSSYSGPAYSRREPRPMYGDLPDISDTAIPLGGSSAPAFAMGDRVRHAKFGGGTVSDLSGAGNDAKITIDFDDEAIGRKRLVVAFAKLERGVEA